jgi:hypothetical protein
MILILSMDVINFLLALLVCIVVIILVFRTRNGLDQVFKLYFGMSLSLLLVALLQLNSYLKILPAQAELTVFKILCFISAIFFLAGSLKFLSIISKASAEK